MTLKKLEFTPESGSVDTYGEGRASKNIICFISFNFVYYVGNMLFCAMNIFNSR